MPDRVAFDAELIRRYGGNGPRYTSYPTIAQFNTLFDFHSYRRSALLSNADPVVSLSAYVHIPFCTRPYFSGGGEMVVTSDPIHAEPYLRRLKREIELQSELFDVRRRLTQLHFGGGTPTLLTVHQLKNLLEHLNRHFRIDISRDREYSIEIDPSTLPRATLPALKALGFNSLSLCVQDFDSEVQRAVNHMQSVEETREAVQQARACGFDSINFDLLYGLPLQTTASFARTLEQVVAMRPDRIAACDYARVPKLLETPHVIDANTRLALLQLTVETLTAMGYVYIGLDRFALPGDELIKAQRGGRLQRNFQGYSIHADCDVLGLGVSAIGKLGDTYSQNTGQLADYYRAIDKGVLPVERGVHLTVDDRTRREIIQQILCNRRLHYRTIEERYALDFKHYFERELRILEAMAVDGLIVLSDEGFEVGPKGRLLLRSIAMVFDAYLRPGTEEFPKTV